MAKNKISDGSTLAWTATAAVSSGDVQVLSSLTGIVADDAVTGDVVTLLLDGVYRLPKATGVAPAIGAALYYDGTEVTTTKSSNTYIGVSAAAATSGAAETTVYCVLNYVPGVINVLGT